MSVTIYDISRELNISAMTVSRVLNQRGGVDRVAPATRERVERKAREMGYRPNNAARALVTGRTNTVAVWISHLRSSVYSQIVDACRAEIRASGREMSVVEMDWHFPAPGSHRRIHWPVDGIIAVDPPEPQMLIDLLGAGPWEQAPRVHIGSGHPVPWEKDYVRIDMGAGARLATEHLIQSGCRRVAYLVPAFVAHLGLGHYTDYRGCVEAAGLSPEVIPYEDWHLAEVRRVVREYVQEHGHPDGIFCYNDEVAIAAFRALRDAGLRIPDDVALIGCEGNEFLEYFDPPLSTVAMPIQEMCRVGWQMLDQRIENPEAPASQVTLAVDFLLRESAMRKPI